MVELEDPFACAAAEVGALLLSCIVTNRLLGQIQHRHRATKTSQRWDIALRLRDTCVVAILDYASSMCGDDSHCHLVANHGCQSGHIDSLQPTSELKAAVSELFAGHVVACSCCNRRVRGV